MFVLAANHSPSPAALGTVQGELSSVVAHKLVLTNGFRHRVLCRTDLLLRWSHDRDHQLRLGITAP